MHSYVYRAFALAALLALPAAGALAAENTVARPSVSEQIAKLSPAEASHPDEIVKIYRREQAATRTPASSVEWNDGRFASGWDVNKGTAGARLR